MSPSDIKVVFTLFSSLIWWKCCLSVRTQSGSFSPFSGVNMSPENSTDLAHLMLTTLLIQVTPITK